MIAAAFVQVLLPIALIVACGAAARRFLTLDLATLNRVSLYVFSPALIFTSISQTQVTGPEAIRMIIFSVLVCLLCGVLVGVGGYMLGQRGAALSSLLLVTMFMNSGNYGLPLSRFAFGDAGFEQAILYFIPQQVLSQMLAVPIARAGAGGLRSAARAVVRMPQLYAVLAAIAVRAFDLRLAERTDFLGGLADGVALLSSATLPFLLVILGMQLASGIVVEQRLTTAGMVSLRLLAAPPLAYLLGLACGLDGLALKIGILQASMPTAVNTIIYATEFGARPRFVAGVVALSTIVSLVTLTILVALLQRW